MSDAERDQGIDDEIPLPPRWQRRRARVAVNLTSLIDVTFLLLIYFIIATSMIAAEEVYRLDMPNRTAGAGSDDPFRLDEEPLRIAVASTGLGPDMYRLHIDGPYPQPASFEELHRFLRSKQVNPESAGSGGGSGALFAPDHPIIIQPAPSARWEHAMEAFNAAARARYTNVTFAAPGP